MANDNELILSPSVIIKRELKVRKIKHSEFAERIGMSKSHFSELINGKRPITTTIAGKISHELGWSIQTLLEMQVKYDAATGKSIVDKAEQEAIELIERYNNIIDVKEIAKRLSITFSKPFNIVLQRLKEQLSLPSPLELADNYTGLFRKSEKTGVDERMIRTWALLADYKVSLLHPKSTFQRESLPQLKSELSAMFHLNENVVENTAKLLSAHGIRFCIVEKVPRASIDGYSFIKDGIPAIVVTQRFNRIDNFAFSVMHELGHIDLHLCQNGDSCVSLIPNEETKESKEEVEANQYAADALIGRKIWSDRPPVRMNPILIQKYYTNWARKKGLNEWIVLGRISKETGMYKFKSTQTRNIN